MKVMAIWFYYVHVDARLTVCVLTTLTSVESQSLMYEYGPEGHLCQVMYYILRFAPNRS